MIFFKKAGALNFDFYQPLFVLKVKFKNEIRIPKLRFSFFIEIEHTIILETIITVKLKSRKTAALVCFPFSLSESTWYQIPRQKQITKIPITLSVRY